MLSRFSDIRLIFGIIIAHGLLFFSFHDKAIFWYIYTGSILVLIAYAMFQEEVDDKVGFFQYIFLGVISGMLLYLIFWLLHQLTGDFRLFRNAKLYNWYAPKDTWQYISLILVIAPGEEVFWRGFIQKRIEKFSSPLVGILISSLLNASVYLYAGSLKLLLALFIAGLAWGLIYWWKKSMPLIIVSHIVFYLMLFIILPLNS